MSSRISCEVRDGSPTVVRLAGDLDLTTRRSVHGVLAVVDGSRDGARPGTPDARAEGGRGLLLVRELTQRWGSVPAGEG